MENPSIFFTIFLIFTGAAIVATVALFARQAMIVAYILLGLIMGPSLLNWVGNAELLQKFADIGIVFLLFLLGLNLHPQKLIALLREATVVTFVSSFLFAVMGTLIAVGFGFACAILC